MYAMKACHACKQELSLGRTLGRREECPHCRADLHCCLNCEYYDRTAPKQCREPAAGLVKEKDKANFCDYFVFAGVSVSAEGPGQTSERARSALDDLFKK